MNRFDAIPGVVRARVQAGERVLLILLDAFGHAFLERHAGHPLIERLDVTPLATQFPSTTTAHIPTLMFDQPVEQHGLYEWTILEPSLQRMICPLRYAFSATEADDTLAGELPPERLIPGPTFAQTLGAPSMALSPHAIARSGFTRFGCAGAEVVGYETLGQGVGLATAALAQGRVAFANLYWEEIDAVGHLQGPSSDAFQAASVAALDAIWEQLRVAPADLTVLFTADHGQIDVSPQRVDYLDQVWPELTRHLAVQHPAGSARDVFLHVQPGSVETVIEALTNRLEDRAQVRRAPELFPEVGPRLAERLGDVVVLPAPGREAWISTAATVERRFLGHHGGLTEAEATTYLAELRR